jgi:hypothetical protein
VRSHAKASFAGSTKQEKGSSFSFGVIATLLACVAVSLVAGASSASAAPTAGPGWAYRTSFGSFEGFIFDGPTSLVAVDANGTIFGVNQNNPVIRIYGPDPVEGGTFQSEFTPEGPGGPRNIAIDRGDGSLYVDGEMSYGGSVVRRYLSDGAPTPTYTLDPSFEVPLAQGIAVDPTTHDLLVADPSAEAVRRYDTTGTLVETIPTPSIAPTWILAAPDGSFYVAPAVGPDVTHFSAAGTQLGAIAGVGAIHGLTLDSADSAIVALVGPTLKTYSTAGTLLSESPAKDGGVSLAFDPGTDLLYEHGRGNGIRVYSAVTVPAVEPPTFSSIGHHTVHLSTEVDPGAGPPAESTMHFEYSEDGGTTWISTPQQEVLAAGTFEADLAGLKPNQAYLVRAVAKNSEASKTTGSVPFSTPEIAPEVITGNPTDVAETSAVLNGAINAGGLQTTFHFEYGLTSAYGSRAPVAIEATAGDSRLNRAYSRTISGLTPGTTYHFRIVATNSLGTTEGADRTFTTTVAGFIPPRFYEQVTPAEKKGIPIDAGFGFFAQADGLKISYLTKNGQGAGPLLTRSMSVRGSEDWSAGTDLDAPLNVYSLSTIYKTTLAVSDDFTHTFVVSNRKLTPDALETGSNVANIYIYDIAAKTYQWVGGSNAPEALQGFVGIGRSGNYQSGAPDLSWVIFSTEIPLLPGDPSPFAPFSDVYRWSEADGLELVSVASDGTPVTAFAPSDHSPAHRVASADGSRVYFTTYQGEAGVYLRENGGGSIPISVSHVTGDPNTAPQAGQLLGVSEDGRYAYFASFFSKLTPDAPEAPGNLYRYDASDDSLEFVGSSKAESPTNTYGDLINMSEDGQTIYFRGTDGANNYNGTKVWRNGVLETVPNFPTVGEGRISPDGRYIAFATADGAIDLFDADTEELSCASCLPDGTPGGGFLPSEGERVIGNRFPQAVTDAGQVFFTTDGRLVAADVNGTNDAYEYQAQGGRLSLISPGNAAFDATFADMSEDGHDVFFTTSQKLVGRDNDQSVDIYDARINGGLPLQNPSPVQECLRDDCKATPNAGPELPFGGSEALSGPGNVAGEPRKRCAKGSHARKVKGKTRCVKQSKKHKKASTNRRQGR